MCILHASLFLFHVPVVVAVDVGGTQIKIGLVENTRVLCRTSIDAHSQIGLAQALPRIADAVKALADRHDCSLEKAEGLAMSFPSLVDSASGKILFGYGKFMDAMDLDVPTWAKESLGLPLFIENDARVAMLGEHLTGAGKGCDDMVMVTLGTGIGVSAMMNGRVVRGAHGQAGILGGHLSVDPNGHRCHCGGLGCAEAEASTSVLPDRARANPFFAESRLATEPVIDYAAVFRLAAAGDGCSAALRKRAIDVWSTMLVNVIHAYDPEIVVVGGGIAAGWDDFMPDVIEQVYSKVHTPWGRVAIAPAMLGNDAALVGCEALLGT